MLEKADDPNGFDDAMREWASRPPRTSPRAAAAAVRQRIAPARTHGAAWQLVAATVAFALALGAGLATWWVHSRQPERAVAEAEPLPPLPGNVMVFWLDRDTPVYFVTRGEP